MITWICAFQDNHTNSNIEYTEQLHKSSADAIRPHAFKVFSTIKLVSAVLHTDSSLMLPWALLPLLGVPAFELVLAAAQQVQHCFCLMARQGGAVARQATLLLPLDQ